MAKLIVSLEGSVIRDYPLAKERVTIGRKPHNDIQIENLAVSGEHACIVTILNDSFLEDLGSTNGTLVNGNSIKKHILQNNDVIEIGKYRLKYVSEAPMAGRTTIDEFEKTMVLRAPGLARAASGRSAEGTPSGPRTMGVMMPPPTPRPPSPSQMFPGGRDPAASAPQAPSRGRDATTSGVGTSPGGRPATTSGPFTSPGSKDPTASRPPAGAAAKPEGTSRPPSSPDIAVVPTPAPAGAPEPPAKPAPGPTATSPGSATESARTSGTEAHPLGAIQILSGSGAGKELDLVKNLTTLGKPGVQVAVITRRPQGYFITHVEGATSPEVNGRALDAQARMLQDHDVIELAGVKMEFFLKK
ncbi:MAG TPA: FHA domain-containing protein [Burkholderiales bacterium]|nr:FHA domain-containing protein [Burkholderiales bacterium]